MKVLVVEDENNIRKLIVDYFKNEDYDVLDAENGKIALDIFQNNLDIDLVILDIMMPEIDGWSVCKRIRKKSNAIIIILTARIEEEDKLLGLELGADEYVTKPFSPKVLVARAKNLINRIDRKKSICDANVLKLNNIEMNLSTHNISINNENINLTAKEFKLLQLLMENKNIVLSREKILDKVWGYDFIGDTRVVDTHIKKLRKKLKENSQNIKTIIGVGYKIIEI